MKVELDKLRTDTIQRGLDKLLRDGGMQEFHGVAAVVASLGQAEQAQIKAAQSSLIEKAVQEHLAKEEAKEQEPPEPKVNGSAEQAAVND